MLKLPIKDYMIVGSYALGTRPAVDIDVICYEKDVECEYKRIDDYCGSFRHNGMKVELLFADKQESFQFILKQRSVRASLINNKADYSTLFALKAGHIHLPSRQWDKHISDYHILKRLSYPYRYGYCTVLNKEPKNANDGLKLFTLEDLIKLHKKSTEDRLGKQRLPKLKNTTKAQFFDDKVKKFFDHDDIHQWFAHKDKPMYTYMQPDPELVYCDPEMWASFTEEEKLQCVMEECYVIASERQLIPSALQLRSVRTYFEPDMAFKWALMRVCTTLCSGWFRQFAIDNYFNVLNNYNRNYPEILKSHIDDYNTRNN